MSGRSERGGGRAQPPGWPVLLVTVALGGCAAHAELPAEVPETTPAPAPSGARTFGWFSIALGAEGAVAAIATSALIVDYKSTRDSGCNAAKMCSADGINANNQIGSLLGWNAGAWVVAAAGLGVGTVLILTHPVDNGYPQRTSITVAPRVTLGGLGLSGSF